ncbi:nuclear transport factor 2 family protein [Flavobacterium sp. MXW15]|uniref:Nuclear transport factor 2 family protein n=1 Tax=Xanthomonas chitinilytica TaxID=2989819 RepID=A0ABT3JW12_9XANT|nr:nuclear transport factor 2 family protein [Xanthomonas sp. H13-6]MCW4455157.1 nuclear transport factor 2 family protein [Flavobacterium sp. MXW15]MCW4472677.1 nuclear transport factor 2 family protein [Xanthomonas sp. H13-6]
MNRKPWICLLSLLMLLVLGGCQRQPPEQRLRETIAQMQAAVEARDSRAFMTHVAEDFAGNGGMDRAALQQMLRAQLLVNASVGVHPGPVSVELAGNTAVVRFTVALTGGSGRLLPERGRVQAITSGWREVDGRWQLYHAQWGEHGGG